MQVLQQAFLWSFSCNMQPVQGAAELGAGQLDVALLRGRCDASLSAGLCGLGTGNVDLIAFTQWFNRHLAEKAKELFVPMYRFCKTTGQNGRILPNSLLRPAIEAVTGIKLGPARLPLAPATEAELDVTLGVLRELGKL